MLASVVKSWPGAASVQLRPRVALWRVRPHTYRTIGSSPLRISSEVSQAIADKRPVVALESTIITHGLPYPDNLVMAKAVEEIIRSQGAIPATMAFIQGQPIVGATAEELEYLSLNAKGAHKISRRDIPYIMSKKLTGGTTIAATMILAHRANIKVFATGGLGGVHRGVAQTWDISADLEELGRTPVGVVCSGPKSILDIPKTLEYLETKGVHVSTYGSLGTNLPGFYARDSGVKSPFNFGSPEEAASILHENHRISLDSGTVFCIPAPEDIALPKEFIDSIIDRALEDCSLQGVTGKDITPFLLHEIWKATDGDSIKTNVEFVKNNALLGAKIAVALTKLEGKPEGTLVESVAIEPVTIESVTVEPVTAEPVAEQPSIALDDSVVAGDRCDAVVVGAVAMDLTCTLDVRSDSVEATSYQGRTVTSIGGVAHNIAVAASHTSKKGSIRLVSEVGADSEEVFAELRREQLDTSGIAENMATSTARYVSMNDGKGDLIVACAAMENIEHMDTDHIVKQLERAKPRIIAFDGNLGKTARQRIVDFARRQRQVSSDECVVVFEPTSVPKAAQLSELDLQVYPNHSIDIATPNRYELKQLFESFSEKDLFDVENWFPVIDTLGINDTMRNGLSMMAKQIPGLEDLVSSGTAQRAFHLIPYIPTLIIKNGDKGVVVFNLLTSDEIKAARSSVSSRFSASKGAFLAYHKGSEYGVLIQHFPAFEVPGHEVVSVSGAGDSFCGVLISELVRNPKWMKDAGDLKKNAIDRAQRAAVLSLQTMEAVNSKLRVEGSI